MTDIPTVMKGVALTGHGGLEKLVWRDDLPVPTPGPDEVLIKVLAAAVNNTDINTRIGWYSKTVRGDTASGAADGIQDFDASDGSWSGSPIPFPRIQGADCCGLVIGVGSGVSDSHLGDRVLIRPMQNRPGPNGRSVVWTFGSECDGGFAEYAVARSSDAIAVSSEWSDVELASLPCAYSTAEGMLQRAAVGAERVLITGASGGVGSAAVQLCKRRGAEVIAMTNPDKAGALAALGADAIVGRDDPLIPDSVDVVVDLVAGPRWPEMIDALVPGGRYVASGAIAGPIVELDVRTLYLKDLTLLGSTQQTDSVFTDLIGYVEADEIKPVIATTFPLKDIRAAQEAFLSKRHIGKIGLSVG